MKSRKGIKLVSTRDWMKAEEGKAGSAEERDYPGGKQTHGCLQISERLLYWRRVDLLHLSTKREAELREESREDV